MVAPLVFYGGAFLINNQMQKARNSRLMEEERQRRELVGSIDMLPPETMANMTPDQAAQFNQEFEFYKEAAMSNDKQLQQVGFAGLARISQQVSQTRESRIAAQRSFIVDESKELRNRTEQVIMQRRAVQSPIDQAAELLADPNFDPNSPVGRGRLSSLLENTSARQLLTDPTDALGTLARAGGVIGLIAAFLKGEEFAVSRDEWRKMFEVLHEYENMQFENQLKQLGTRATELDQAGQEIGVYPKGYSVLNQVLGPIRESEGMFENPFTERRLPADSAGPADTDGNGVSSGPRGLINQAQERLDASRRREEERREQTMTSMRNEIQSLDDTQLRDMRLDRPGVVWFDQELKDRHKFMDEEIQRRKDAGVWSPEKTPFRENPGRRLKESFFGAGIDQRLIESGVNPGEADMIVDQLAMYISRDYSLEQTMVTGSRVMGAVQATDPTASITGQQPVPQPTREQEIALGLGTDADVPPMVESIIQDISTMTAAEILELLQEMEGRR